jgi:type IV pilus assembly protein PilY1
MQLVLIFGGGYDATQENQPYNSDTVGNRIFMVDAETGKLLWYGAGKSQTGSSGNRKEFDEMNNSIPAPVTPLDINGDGFADRMYVGDMGGRVWRFDIFNNKAANELVTGGVLAKLGAGGMGANPAASTARRFYNAADVALIQQTGQNPYYNIAIGSGYRGHPLNTVTEEHFYSLRDKRPFGLMPQSAYNELKPILASDANLVDITADPAGTPVGPEKLGWKLRVSAQSGRSGEKVLSKATTFADVVLFTTFQPGATAQDSCLPAYVNRMYALYASSGKPALNLNNTGNIDNSDVSKTLDNTSGIAGGVQIGIDYPLPSGDGSGGDNGGGGNGNGNGGGNSASSGGPQCLVNLQVIPCPPGGGTARTFWKRKNAK